MTEIVGFVGSSHVDRSPNFDAQRCVNMYPQVSASGTAKTAAKLVSAPGLVTWNNATADGAYNVRGTLVFDPDSAFAVIGRRVYRYTAAGVRTFLGAIPYLDTPVCMCTNGINVVFVTGGQMWVIDPIVNTLTEFTDPSFVGADAIWFINGSYVFNEPNSGRFWVMDQYSMVLDPLAFATAEGAPDGLVSLVVNNQEIWLYGVNTIEVWAGDATNPDFPYARISGVFIEQGCAAVYSIARMDTSIFWLSSNANGQGIVFRTVGFQAQRISSHSLEAAIATYTVITDAVGYCYQQEGHSFYVLSFPTEDVTWVYDSVTNTWHQRAWRKENGQFGRHRSNCHMFFNRMNMVGDWETGKIYQMSTLLYSDDGQPLVRLRASPHISNQNTWIAHTSIQFDLQAGVGLATGQGSNPLVMVRWSDDGGHTWTSEKQMSIGRVGEYTVRARLTRLGRSRDRIYELSCSDPVPFTVLQALMNVQ